jgi:CheY-like chemotaxis protein
MPDAPPRIVAVMSDLFFSAKINDTAKRLGITVEFINDKAVAMNTTKDQVKTKPALVLIDLNWEVDDPMDLIARLKADPETRAIPTLGFVSHVRIDLKNKAEQNGCDLVVARSVFARDLAGILERATGGQRFEAD